MNMLEASAPPPSKVTTYVHSGRVPLGGLLLAALLSPLAAALCGFVYAYLFRYVPFVYLNFLITLGYGFLMGLSVTMTLEMGKIRNTSVNVLLALFTTTLGIYIYWGAYLWACHGWDIGLAAWSPSVLLSFAQDLFENGSWGLGNTTITGWFLVLFWLAEAVLLYGMTIFCSLVDAHKPFCEACNVWTKSEQGLVLFAGDGTDSAWPEVLSGHWRQLEKIPLLAEASSQYVRLDLTTCPSCGGANYLTIQRVTITRDDKGEESKDETALLTNAALTPSDVQFIRSLPDIAPLQS